MVEYVNRHILMLFPSSSLRPRCQLLPLLNGWQVEHATLRRYVLFSAASLLMAVALAFLLGTNTCGMEIGSLLRNKLVRFVACHRVSFIAAAISQTWTLLPVWHVLRDQVILTPSVPAAVIATYASAPWRAVS